MIGMTIVTSFFEIIFNTYQEAHTEREADHTASPLLLLSFYTSTSITTLTDTVATFIDAPKRIAGAGNANMPCQRSNYAEWVNLHPRRYQVWSLS
jgi:hypothetical protein